MKEKLRKAYARELKSGLKSGELDWPDKSETAIQGCINKMFKAISSPARNDWLKYNTALKRACRSIGIKSSPELRAIFT